MRRRLCSLAGLSLVLAAAILGHARLMATDPAAHRTGCTSLSTLALSTLARARALAAATRAGIGISLVVIRHVDFHADVNTTAIIGPWWPLWCLW